MLDDGAHRFVKLLRQVPRRLQIHNVVVAEFLALKLLAIRDALAGAVGVQRGLLMRILTVTQIEGFVERKAQSLGKALPLASSNFLPLPSQRCRSKWRQSRVIRRGGGKCLLRQTPLGRQRQRRRCLPSPARWHRSRQAK